jgi:hypothetical protein
MRGNLLVSLEELLLAVREDAVLKKILDPLAPDPEEMYQLLTDLAARYPPPVKNGRYDFTPMIMWAALECSTESGQLIDDVSGEPARAPEIGDTAPLRGRSHSLTRAASGVRQVTVG